MCNSQAQLAGVWRRTLLLDAHGADVTTEVTWLQGRGVYVDLRRPAGRPSFDAVRRLRDLSDEQVRWIATQEGFAGPLIGREQHFEWNRRIDLHPPGTHPDAGTLHREDDLLVERGRHADYVEHWQLEPGVSEPVWARDLVDAATGTRATVLRVGSRFGWARGRHGALEWVQPLGAAIDAAPSLDAARRVVDVEVSVGAVAGSTWTVTASTLPFRETTVLDISCAGDGGLAIRDQAADGRVTRSTWTVTYAEGEVVI